LVSLIFYQNLQQIQTQGAWHEDSMQNIYYVSWFIGEHLFAFRHYALFLNMEHMIFHCIIFRNSP